MIPRLSNEEVNIMGRAFDIAMRRLHGTNTITDSNSIVVQKAVGKAILAGFSKGEKDSSRLARRAMFAVWQIVTATT